MVSGILPSVVSALFGYLLPIIIRKISKYQGAPTRSRLDRAVTARYFFFMIISNLVIFSLLGVVYTAIARIVVQIGGHQSASTILKGFEDIPDQIQGTYVQQSTCMFFIIIIILLRFSKRLLGKADNKKHRLVDLVAAPRFLGHFRIDPVDQIGHGIYPKVHVFSYPSRY